jgi:spore coat protein H
VFEETALRTYELTLDAAVWAALQLNAQEEEYAEATLRLEGTELERVGLRFKGSSGTLASCFDEAGERICPKLSMKLKVDEYLPDQRLRGLKRLTFNSMSSDPSQLHERIAYRLFREMGVTAPRAVHARLVVNGESLGLFSLVEDVDGRFTDDRFQGGDGNLYKEQWTDSADADLLTSRLVTNEDAPDHSVLLQLNSELVAAEPGELPAVLARYMDPAELFAYVAVDRSINNWDGMSAFYCYDVDCENHNYYLYQHEDEPRFSLIPWDLDNTFALTTPLDEVEGVFEIPADCSLRHPAFGKQVMPPACDRLLQGLARSDRAGYVAALDRLLAGPMASENVESWIAAWRAQIEPVVAEDLYGPGLPEFRSGIESLQSRLSELRMRALADRDSQL